MADWIAGQNLESYFNTHEIELPPESLRYCTLANVYIREKH